jgi:hypothetical protein
VFSFSRYDNVSLSGPAELDSANAIHKYTEFLYYEVTADLWMREAQFTTLRDMLETIKDPSEADAAGHRFRRPVLQLPQHQQLKMGMAGHEVGIEKPTKTFGKPLREL